MKTTPQMTTEQKSQLATLIVKYQVPNAFFNDLLTTLKRAGRHLPFNVLKFKKCSLQKNVDEMEYANYISNLTYFDENIPNRNYTVKQVG